MQLFVKRAIVVIALLAVSAGAKEQVGNEVAFTPIEHATLVIEAKEAVIYVDPVGAADRFTAFANPDLILITHIHGDHLAPDLIKALKTQKTTILGPSSVIDQLGYGKALANGDTTTFRGIRIEAVPAYNTTPERQRFHPKGRDNGYILTLGEKRLYISGDTEDTPEMRKLENIDYAFVSMNLPYTMSIDQAVSAVREMKPGAVSPYHYRGQGGLSDVNAFQRRVQMDGDIKVHLLDWYAE